ncbi:cohesin domain-containing protein [Pelotalea chapellei]|uniref:Type II secretion system protein n=1 Tax=Pelotalea chapellei TaxID=44671 RepID=A0ABS5U717_9BACT|nr:cohesin domain-containing protein [Pelotalea chapellei]MBT1071438.1 type II secretion system protein [Pelotalea chapellei]
MRYLTLLLLALLAASFLLSGCSSATRSFSRGEKLESEGKFEEAMYSYADAFMKDPEEGNYRVHFFNMREKAAKQRATRGNDALAKNEYAAALEEFRAGYALDPTQERLKQQADLAARLKEGKQAYLEGMEFEKGNKFKAAHLAYLRALELDPENKEYKIALNRVSGMRKNKLEGQELNLKSTKPITLKFKDAKLKDVFNIITQLSGINFIFDEGIKDQPVSIYLENATFQQAMDLLTNMFKLGRKIANESTIIIYPKTPDKAKQYEDMQVRTFHLNFMDAKKAVNLIRTMIQVRKVFVNEDSNSVVVRDTSDIVDVVEKILEANDVPDPEVVLDVEVVEISDRKAQNVGLLLSNYNVQLGAYTPAGNPLVNSLTAATTIPSAGQSATTTTTAQVSNLLQAFTLRGYGGFITVPSAQYNLGKNLTNGEVLSNPKIRVKNKEKSKFNVGTRVPITTTTLNGTLSQVNVQYVDVGVKVNAEPTIQLNNEIVIKLSLEVSSILNKESVGGSDSPTTVVTIGTRNLDTVLSLKDGETSIIGGLIQNTKNESKQKIFLLGDLPLIGPLISNTESSKDKTELLLAITPRLVRGVTVPQHNLMSFSSGKEDDPSLVRPLASFEQEPEFETQQGQLPRPGMTPPRQIQPPKASAPGPVPAPVVPVNPLTPPLPVPGAPPTGAPIENQPVTNTNAGQVATPAPPQRALLQIGTPGAVSVGQQFTLEIKVGDVTNLIAAPFVMTYDPIFTEFVSGAEAGFLKKDGKPTVFSSKGDPASGTVTVNMARAAGSGGVSGGGSLAFLTFRAINQGPANFGFRSVSFSSADGQSITVLPFSTAIELK